MNRITLIGILVLFSACSHYEEVARNPASFKNETCDKIIEGFLSIAIAKNDSIDSYLNKGIFNSDDLKILKEGNTSSFVNKYPEADRSKVELGILFILKKYPHLDSHRIIKHYGFLEEFCGM